MKLCNCCVPYDKRVSCGHCGIGLCESSPLSALMLSSHPFPGTTTFMHTTLNRPTSSFTHPTSTEASFTYTMLFNRSHACCFVSHTEIFYQFFFKISFTVNDVNCVLCVLILCTFYFHVVTAVCQLLINWYVMLCYVARFSAHIKYFLSYFIVSYHQNGPYVYSRQINRIHSTRCLLVCAFILWNLPKFCI